MSLRFFTIVITVMIYGSICSCTKEQADDKMVLINPTAAKTEKASAIFSNIEYIPLSGPLIGQPGKKVIQHDNRFFFSTAYPACVQIYDSQGNHFSGICAQGEGPGKYQGISDFVVLQDAIFILSRNDLKIFKYALINGTFIRDYRIPVFAAKFEIMSDDNFILYCGNERTEHNDSKVVFFNLETEVVSAGPFPIDLKQAKYLNFFDRNNFLRTYDDKVLFFYGFNDTIYQINGAQATPYRIVDFGKYSIPASFYEQDYQDVMDFMTKVRASDNDFAARVIGYYETPTHLSFIFEHRQQFLLVLYDKRTRNYHLCNQLTDDVHLAGFILYDDAGKGPVGVTSENELIFMQDAGYFSAWADALKTTMSDDEWQIFLKQHPQVQKIDAQIDESSNPVLILARFP